MEAKLIEKFVLDLDSLASYKSNYRKFSSSLKPGSYANGGGMVMTKLTPEQSAYYQRTKPFKDYLDSVRNRLNSYLSDTLTRLLANQGLHPSFCEIFLKFSTENKLLEVKTADQLTDSEDRKNFRLCKKWIIDAFRSIDINFVNSKLAYWKKVEIDNDGIIVSEPFDYFAEPIIAK
jgi:hypothetical protein